MKIKPAWIISLVRAGATGAEIKSLIKTEHFNATEFAEWLEYEQDSLTPDSSTLPLHAHLTEVIEELQIEALKEVDE